MGLAQGQCEPRRLPVGRGAGGKFCRGGIICREIGAMTAAKAIVLSTFFLWHAAC
jgi:hypothetical protein